MGAVQKQEHQSKNFSVGMDHNVMARVDGSRMSNKAMVQKEEHQSRNFSEGLDVNLVGRVDRFRASERETAHMRRTSETEIAHTQQEHQSQYFAAGGLDHNVSTLMIQGLEQSYTQEVFVADLTAAGFGPGAFDIMYLPFMLARRECQGYTV